MTARYGLPDRLFTPVKTGVILAWNIADKDDEPYNGTPITEVAEKWYHLVERGYHQNLLSTSEAAELMAVIALGAEYADNNNYADPVDMEDFSEDVEFALAAEEILFTLKDLVRTGDRVAA